ncbi:MAG TPA: nitrilase-related carbon-nitrogen hydrolase [Fimbriimonadaceae bacterium]|nr:beta-ureidopropionase [Armatimonadota bacterium]HRD31890.1 nitrilase-related carbon-nitrogen hydrolase [Fimbriimonadaceae bacterium]HRE94990.1 nitrilase-related carbon-nitrogen hydrolase [Fimbriimonadaceae bacterium]HRI75299.1 nitrilase-related carbon-nitrogen hydrolase [Fimbriimonadaceae bacterium]
MPYQLAVAQFSPEKGRASANAARIGELVHQAAAKGAELVVFPESIWTGYFLEGGADEHSARPEQVADELAPHVLGVGPLEIILGYYEQSDGRPYNSAVHLLVEGGQVTVRGNYRKIFLPTYGVFDEARFHAPGDHLGVFETRHGRVGCLICEDVWHSTMGTLLALAGCHLVVVPSASPARGFQNEKPGNLLRYERMVSAMAEEHGVYGAASMLCGFEGGKGFTGGSFIIGPDGVALGQAPLLEEAIVMAEVDEAEVRACRMRTPLLEDLRENWARLLAMSAPHIEAPSPMPRD